MAMDCCCLWDLNDMFENATILLDKITQQSAKSAISSSNDVELLANGILSSKLYIPPPIQAFYWYWYCFGFEGSGKRSRESEASRWEKYI